MYDCQPNDQSFTYTAAADEDINLSLSHTDFDACYKDLFGQIATILESHAQTISSLKANVESIKTDLASLRERAESPSKGIVTNGVWINNDCYSQNGSLGAALSMLALKESGLLDKFVDEINNPTDLPGGA